MSLFAGICFLTLSLLLFRALKIWNQKYGPIGRFANGVMENFLVPLIAAGLVTGSGVSVASIVAGTSWQDTGAAVLAGVVFVLIWRALGTLPGRNAVLPFTSEPGAEHSWQAAEARSPQKAA